MNSPALQQTSSIGAMWPPSPASFDRIRGFYAEGVVSSQPQADILNQAAASAIEQMSNSESSRVSLRFVAELGALSSLTFEPSAVEAALPIAGDTGLGIVYLGANRPDRQMDSRRLDAHRNNLEYIMGLVPKAATPNGITVELVDPANAAEQAPEFAPLYEIFGYDERDTEELLGSEQNTIAYATVNGKVVSTAMAEHGTIPVNGPGNVTVAEITEAVTDPAYRGNGLYEIVSGFLTRRLLDMHHSGEQPLSAIYGESNLAMQGVLRAAVRNGRRFNISDGPLLGLSGKAFGILPQNVSVRDGVETRKYNDFALSYVPL